MKNRLLPAMTGLCLCGLLACGCAGRETKATGAGDPHAPGVRGKHLQRPTLTDIVPKTDTSDPASFVLVFSNKEYVTSFKGKKDTANTLTELKALIRQHRPEITRNEIILVPAPETKLVVMTEVIAVLKENKLGMRLAVPKEGQ